MYFCREPISGTNKGRLLELFSKHLGVCGVLLHLLLSGLLLTEWVIPQWMEISALKKEIKLIEFKRRRSDSLRASVVRDYGAIELPSRTQDGLDDPDLLKSDISTLLEEISQKAKACGMTIQNFAPMSATESQGAIVTPLQIFLEGSYHQIMGFFDEVIKLIGIHAIDDISIERDVQTEQAESPHLRLRLMMLTYRAFKKGEEESRKDVIPLKPLDLSEMIPRAQKIGISKNSQYDGQD